MAKKEKARYSKPASQVDLEERLENENRSSRVLSTSDSYREQADDGNAREFAVEDNELEGYIGVDPVYQSYAVDTDKPLEAEEGVEKELLDQFYDSVEPQPEPSTEGDESSEEDAPAEDETGDAGGSTTAAVTPGASSSDNK